MESAERSTPLGNTLKVFFSPQPHVDISGPVKASYKVRFTDSQTGLNVYTTTVETGHWVAPNPRYFVRWHIQVEENGTKFLDYTLDLRGKPVLIVLNSTALGDTIAWLPAVERFRQLHGCTVTVRTYFNSLFEANYPELRFEKPEPLIKYDQFCCYVVGCGDNNYHENKNNWRSVPLQQIATDYLGLPYQAERARIVRSKYPSQVTGKYVAISEGANGYLAKRWIHPGGWQKVVDYLVGLGYKVVSVSVEPTDLKNVLKRNGKSIDKTIRTIQHADMFIGCDSGPSWLAWALGVPTIVISGFTERWGGAPTPYRVINESVCHGCINDHNVPVDRGCFMYCPRGRNHECSLSITPEMVIEQVERVVKEINNRPLTGPYAAPSDTGRRVLLLLPHCSTGGMPQYVVKQTEDLKAAGFNVAAVEWKNLSNDYVVQRRIMQALLGDQYHMVSEDGQRLMAIISDFKPEAVHLHEAPEIMLPQDVANRLFMPSLRDHRIVLTLHNAAFGPQDTRYWPDAYAYVSGHHMRTFAEATNERNIPWQVIEYRLARKNPRVLNVGLWTPDKNQGEVLEVARRLPHIQFDMVGNQAPNFAHYWQPLMASKPANVVVHGERDDVDWFYESADLFLFPSLRELRPLVVQEALSYGLPVLMRNLRVYYGEYDFHQLVTYIDGNTDKTAKMIERLLPANVPSMADNLGQLYSQTCSRS